MCSDSAPARTGVEWRNTLRLAEIRPAASLSRGPSARAELAGCREFPAFVESQALSCESSHHSPVSRRLSCAGVVAFRHHRGAVPGAIATLRAHETEFRRTFSIVRGSRPLHITAVPSGGVFWGEYFDNADRDQVHIYGSADGGMSWDGGYTFSKSAIRHVHNIV